MQGGMRDIFGGGKKSITEILPDLLGDCNPNTLQNQAANPMKNLIN